MAKDYLFHCITCDKQKTINLRGYRSPPKYCSRKCQPGPMKINWSSPSDPEVKEMLRTYFEKKVIRKDGCWSWDGYLDKDGYPTCNQNGIVKGHRLSWIIHFGDIPEGFYICHKCDNPECTNPEHLFLGKPKDNSQDMVMKNRQDCQKGSKHFNSKLDESLVIEIKQEIDDGKKLINLAKKYCISRPVLTQIKKGRAWKHVGV